MRKTAHSNKGFTLVELLVVIAIIAILAAVVVLIINPLELTKRGRDSVRLADLASLQTAINVAVQEGPGGNAVLCADGNDPCGGKSNADGRGNAGTDGWVRVDLGTQGAVSIPTLPVDPVNDATYHYVYCGDVTNGVWEINAVLESVLQMPRMANDGGGQNLLDTTGRYEIGTNLDLLTATSAAPCAY